MPLREALLDLADLARIPVKPLCLVFLAAVLAGGDGHAQSQSSNQMAPAPIKGERLSDWLLRRPQSEADFPAGLIWQVPSAQEAQLGLKNQLLDAIARSDTVLETDRLSLARLIKALPVTGRVRIEIPDARWLQAHPKADPILQPDHVVLMPKKPKVVNVLRQEGSWCVIEHLPGWQARDYLRACGKIELKKIDRVWLIQADGVVRDFGIAPWNEQAQDDPGPGSLIWAPARDSGWSERITELLTRFLATQSHDTILQAAGETSPLATTHLGPRMPAAKDSVVTSNNWGLIGLVQTPTARFSPAGEVRFNYSQIYPYSRYNVFLQPFDWLEAGFRYTDISNRNYGPASLSGNQTYKDKSIDFKLRLWPETAALPQLALGVVDLGGTGLFSSEYVVASKRFSRFDWSLGMGWGNMGTSGNIKNPLLIFGRGFDTRGAGVATGGTPNTGAFFRGPAALFGGLQYHSPWENWIFKAEYDGNNYQNQPLANNQSQRIPLNFGLVYRYHPSLDLSVGIERGNALMIGFTLQTSMGKLSTPKVSDPATPRTLINQRTVLPGWEGTAIDVVSMSRWGVRSLTLEGDTLRVMLDGLGGAHWDDRIERIAAILHRDAPTSVEYFRLIFTEQGVPLSERLIIRDLWVTKNTELHPNFERLAERRILRNVWVTRNSEFRTDLSSLSETLPAEPLYNEPVVDNSVWKRPQSRFSYALVPTWQQNIGGPDGFVLFRVGFSVPARFKVNESTFIAGATSVNLFDNFDRFKYTGPSRLPRVRTYLREYMTESRVNVPFLQLTHFGQLAPSHYYSLYGGYLETMYGGVGGEWLYRPWHSPLALGIDINQVQQRDFDQFFGFRNVSSQTGYRVATGHATLYWDTGWKSTHARLSVGRYLAKDIGATLDLSRTFKNGVTIGAWATRTNVSAEIFGEGSFDKGMYLRIPFDVMTTSRGGDVANLVYNPLTRDGGARLNRNFTLYSATTARSKQDTSYGPPQ